MSYGRTAIEDKLEPAARDLIEAIDAGAVLRDDPDELWAKVNALHEVIDELDALDNDRALKKRASLAMKELRRVLLEALPLSKLTAGNGGNCPGDGYWTRRCSFRAAWNYPGGTARCKRHAESARGREAGERIDTAYESATGAKLDYFARQRATFEQVEATAEKLGVKLPEIPA